MKTRKYYDDKGNVGEITFDGHVPFAQLKTPGTHGWDGTAEGIRRPPVNNPPDLLYACKSGTLEELEAWLTAQGFKYVPSQAELEVVSAKEQPIKYVRYVDEGADVDIPYRGFCVSLRLDPDGKHYLRVFAADKNVTSHFFGQPKVDFTGATLRDTFYKIDNYHRERTPK